MEMSLLTLLQASQRFLDKITLVCHKRQVFLCIGSCVTDAGSACGSP